MKGFRWEGCGNWRPKKKRSCGTLRRRRPATRTAGGESHSSEVSILRASGRQSDRFAGRPRGRHDPAAARMPEMRTALHDVRSEEHTSELQSQFHLVCRLLLEKKKTK